MAKTETPMSDVDESMIERILELFQSNSAAVAYGTDPNGWVEENLGEGTEAGDVARCMPEVTERLGGAYQANAARYNAHHGTGSPATHSAVNELSYTYNTIYQQNTFIYAEEGSQVVNIQGDGNHVTQTDIDVDFDVDTGQYEDGYEQGYEDGYEGDEAPGNDHDPVEDGHDDPDAGDDTETGEGVEDGWEDPATGEDPDQAEDGWEDPTTTDQVDEGWEEPTETGHDNPFDDTAGEPAGEGADQVAEAAEML